MTERTAAGNDPATPFTTLESEIVDHLFVLQPSYAVFLGLHGYDGRVPDLSRAGTDAWVRTARRLLERLEAIPEAALPPARRLDRLLLRLLLEGPIFDLTESGDYDRNPMVYVGQLSLTSYMVRAYAPADDRARAMIRTLEGIPKLLEQGLARLEPHLPPPFLRLTEAMASGIPSHLDEAEAFVRRSAPDLLPEFAPARALAGAAMERFREQMRTVFLPVATGDFALGKERFQRLLWVREGVTMPVDDLLAAGTADLQRNQDRLRSLAVASGPGYTVTKLLAEMFEEHPTAAELLPRARGFVEEARAFVLEKDLVTIPAPDRCLVEETPSYGRALSTASMNPPGPFEAGQEHGIYYVTPVDPSWSAKQAEEWLRSFNDALLRNVTVHEVYPGHYVQFLHHRRGTGSLVRKVFFSGSFTEGWAHYAEQLAVENGIAGGSVRAEVAQIHDALLRDVRLIAAIGLHTQGRDLEWATRLFETEAYFERLPSEREAIRGTFDPGYFCYTLGKLAILQARAKYLGPRFGGSLQKFHDALLGFGSPPVGRLDDILALAPP